MVSVRTTLGIHLMFSVEYFSNYQNVLENNRSTGCSLTDVPETLTIHSWGLVSTLNTLIKLICGTRLIQSPIRLFMWNRLNLTLSVHSVCSEPVLVTTSPVSYSSRGNYNLLVHSDTRKNLSRYWMVSSTIRGGGFIFKRRFSLRRLQIYEFQMYVEKKFEGKVHVNFCTIKCWKLVKNGIK